ncbi:MAG: hypothetical protein WCQ57_02265 [Verrucomicrobiota bacterium]
MRVLPFPVRQLQRVAGQVCVVTGRFEWKAIQGSRLDGKIVKKKQESSQGWKTPRWF